MAATRAQRERVERDREAVLALLPRCRLETIARRVGRTPEGLRAFLARERIAYTRDCGYLTPGELSREYVALTAQRITALCRSGAIRARRGQPRTRGARRGHWLIAIDLVPALQDRYGARGARVRWDTRPGRGRGGRP